MNADSATKPARSHAACCTATLACAGLLLLCGCAGYDDQTKAIRQAWTAGNNERAAELATAAAETYKDSGDAIAFGLESGSALRASGKFEQSSKQFADTEAKMRKYAAGADIRLADEAGATLTNLSYLPYTGTAYDKVMLSTYQALNDMQLGRMDAARVNLNRALEYQRQAVADNARAIEAANSAAEKNHSDLDVERTRGAVPVGQLDSASSGIVSTQAYADYVNPFTVLLDGLFFLYQGTGGSDLERARMSLRRVAGMGEAEAYVREDLAAVDARIRMETPEPTTYVFFETGMAARRDQVRIDIPLFIFGLREVPYFGAAFPKLVTNENFAQYLDVKAGGKTYRTQIVCRMDNVIAREFDNELPLVITKTLLSSGAKAAATYGLSAAGEQIGGGDTGKLIGNLMLMAGTIYQAAMNQADLRSWVTLPKYFEYARLPTPADHRLTLTTQTGQTSLAVDLEPALVNVVYAKSNSAQAPLQVFQFVLLPLPEGAARPTQTAQPAPAAPAAESNP